MKKEALIFRCKKGNTVSDTISVVVMLLIFAFAGIFGKYAFNEINDDIQADSDMTNKTKTVVGDIHARSGSFFDGLFIFFLVLIWALMLVASFVVDSHPIFFVFALILMIFVFFVAAELGNAYEEVTDDSDLAPVVASDFPMTDWIMSHFLLVAIVIGFSIIIVLFGKSRFKE